MTFYHVDTHFCPAIDLRCVRAAASWAALMLRRWWVPKSRRPSSSLASCQEAAHPSSGCRLRLFFAMYPLVYIYVGVHMPWHVCGTQRTMFGGCFPPSAVWPGGQAQVVVAGNPPHLSGGLTGAELDLFEDPLPCFLQELLHPHSPNGAQHFNFSTLLSTFESVFVSFPYCREKTQHRSSVREEGLFRHSLSGSQGGRAWSCCL